MAQIVNYIMFSFFSAGDVSFAVKNISVLLYCKIYGEYYNFVLLQGSFKCRDIFFYNHPVGRDVKIDTHAKNDVRFYCNHIKAFKNGRQMAICSKASVTLHGNRV